ncbi:hypothetical protein SynSYN20_02522 [Synechococcus sp. SYN20]|nr:hypothetical protein SynSYN20_02522 [Synechococcus sp. SYN20]
MIFRELLEVEIVFQRIPGLSVAEASVIFPDPLQRRELIELLVLTEMIVNPIPVELERSLEHWADALNVPRPIPCLGQRCSNPSQGSSSE